MVSLNDSGNDSMRDEVDVLTSDQSFEYGRSLRCYPSPVEKVEV